jgi:HK97 family phage portal protein
LGLRDLLFGSGALPQPQASTWVEPPDWSDYEPAGFTSSAQDYIRSLTSGDAQGTLYDTQWAVRTCVNFLALNIAHLNLKTYRRTESAPESVRDHPLAKLIQHPNDRMDRFGLVRATVSDLAIYDNAFWLKRFQDDKRLLYLIPPSYIQVEGGNVLTGPKKYVLSNGSNRQELSPDEVVHFHGYNPVDTRSGSSILIALRSVLMEEVEASRYRSKFWAKGAHIPGTILRGENAPAWGEPERNRFREGWRRFRRGGAMEGEEPILEDGMQYVPSGFSPKDSAFIEGREWVLETVAKAYQIPLSMLSSKGTATYASMKEFHNILYTDVLGPWNAMLESAINAQLVPEFNDDDLYVEFNIDEKLQGDFEQQAAAARNSVQVPWESVNGIRRKRNEPPIGDPNDPNNPYNQPARPTNYAYGDAEAPQQLGFDDELETMLEGTPR